MIEVTLIEPIVVHASADACDSLEDWRDELEARSETNVPIPKKSTPRMSVRPSERLYRTQRRSTERAPSRSPPA